MPTLHIRRALRVLPVTSLVLAAFVFALAIAPGVALAHAKVQSSSPANGSTVSAGLTQISVVFSEEISPDQSSAQLVGPAGAMTEGVTAAVDRADRTKLAISTPALAAGEYTVKWTAVTEDDNGQTSGEIAFTVAAAGSATTTSNPPASDQSMPATGSEELPLRLLLLAGSALVLFALGLRLRLKAEA